MEYILSNWSCEHWVLVIGTFILSCAIDAKVSLDKFRQINKNESSDEKYVINDFSGERIIMFEHDAIYYGMGVGKNIIASIFFPWCIISYILPGIILALNENNEPAQPPPVAQSSSFVNQPKGTTAPIGETVQPTGAAYTYRPTYTEDNCSSCDEDEILLAPSEITNKNKN